MAIKYSSSGMQQWVRKYTYSTTWSPSNTNSAKAIIVDKIGNIYVTGTYSYYHYSGTDFGTTTIKYNSDGDSIWVRRFINAGDYYSSITIDRLNNIYISTGLPDTIPNGGGGYLTIKYDISGVLGWYMFYTVNCQYFGSQSRAIVSDSSGNVYITGGSETPNCFNWWDITTIKYSQPLFGIKKIGSNIPQSYKLFQNYPNPFNPNTVIKYDIPNDGYVSLKVYDILGKEVATLVNEYKHTGYYEVKFDASKLSSGMYFYRIIAGDFNAVKKMVLVK